MKLSFTVKKQWYDITREKEKDFKAGSIRIKRENLLTKCSGLINGTKVVL
jgi:hypothetical protein